jgi:23S rRNA pseudouridine2605 synthase
MEERLQKLLAQAGHGSRRACEEYLVQGRVRVNGRVAELGQKADPEVDEITFDGQALARPEKRTYILLYKPRGVVSSLEPQGDRKTVMDLVPADERLYPVGRLDLDSEGLILLTNDGDLTNRITHPRYETEKEYRVLLGDEPDSKQLNAWRHGVVLEGQRTAPAEVEREGHTAEGTWLKVVMHEGRKHEIRDIARTLGLWVHRLIRVRLGALTIGALKPGQWRPLEPKEIAQLKKPAGRQPRREAQRSRPASNTGPAARGERPPLEMNRRRPGAASRRRY